eukprot:6175456-Pleurochrysis_carterae.AAC.3
MNYPAPHLPRRSKHVSDYMPNLWGVPFDTLYVGDCEVEAPPSLGRQPCESGLQARRPRGLERWVARHVCMHVEPAALWPVRSKGEAVNGRMTKRQAALIERACERFEAAASCAQEACDGCAVRRRAGRGSRGARTSQRRGGSPEVATNPRQQTPPPLASGLRGESRTRIVRGGERIQHLQSREGRVASSVESNAHGIVRGVVSISTSSQERAQTERAGIRRVGRGRTME